MPIEARAAHVTAPSVRHHTFRGLAILFAAGTALASFGLPSALTAWSTTGAELPLRTHYVVWGALAGVLVPVASGALVKRGWDVAPMQQLLAFVASAVVGLALAFDVENAAYIAAFTVPILLIFALHPDRSRILEVGERPDRWMLGLAAVAAVPATMYAVVNLRLSAATDYTHELHGGYAHAGILALLLVASMIVVAQGSAGWQVPAWTTVVGGSMLGAAGVLYPADPSSVGRPGGIGILIGSGMLAALTLTRDRRLESPRGSRPTVR